MDARSLQDLWQGPSPFLAQMGEQAFNLDQQKRQADLATTLGMEQRNAAMHPLEMQNKQAVTDLNKSTAAMNQYALDTKLPREQALAQAMQKFHKESDDMTRSQTREQVLRNMQIAAIAKQNGGALPPGIQLKPEEMAQFSPANLDKIIKFGETFLQYDPEEISKRQRAAEALKLEGVRAQGRIDLKSMAAPGKAGSITPTMDNNGIVAQMSKLKEARQKLAFLKTVLPQLTEEQQAQWQGPYLALKKQAEGELSARNAGEVDVATTTKGKVAVNPPVNLGDAPPAVTNRAARQEATQAPKYTQSDLEFTAKKYNMTVEQVKKQLGIK